MAHKHQDLINKLSNCIAACQHCADACLDEDGDMADCIRTDRDCADICSLALNLVARDSDKAADVLELCADMCEACAEECAGHDHDHCQACAEACRECANACRNY